MNGSLLLNVLPRHAVGDMPDNMQPHSVPRRNSSACGGSRFAATIPQFALDCGNIALVELCVPVERACRGMGPPLPDFVMRVVCLGSDEQVAA